MRQKKLMKQLEDKAGTVCFPKSDDSFSAFKRDLKRVVEENLGYSIANTLEWDEHEQVFWVTVDVSGSLLPTLFRKSVSALPEDDRVAVKLTKCLKIDPHYDLAPQIAEIDRVREHLQSRYNMVQVLLELHLEGKAKQCDPSHSQETSSVS